jgi:hypothetical protein
MKRLMVVCTLTIVMSSSVLAGHTTPGFGWCDCNEPEICSTKIIRDDQEQVDTQQNQAPNGELSRLDLIVDALLMLIRF